MATVVRPSHFTTSFQKCPSKPLPRHFGPGKSLQTCLVYLAPRHGKLKGVTYRPSEEFNPITWTGTITEIEKPDKDKKHGKDDKDNKHKKGGNGG